MADALDVVEAELFALLNGIVSAPVYQHVAEDTAAPFVMIGELADQPMVTKGDGDSVVTAQIAVVTEGEQRRPLNLLLAEIRDALDGKVRNRGGWELHFAFARRSATRSPDRAEVYVGNATFEIIALKSA